MYSEALLGSILCLERQGSITKRGSPPEAGLNGAWGRDWAGGVVSANKQTEDFMCLDQAK